MENNRNSFIRFLINSLQGYDYALLKHFYNSARELPENSDMDILIQERDTKDLLFILKQFDEIQNFAELNSNHLTQVFIHFNDGGFIQLDFISRFYRKHLEFMSVEEALQESHVNDRGISVLPDYLNYEYVFLFHILNKADFPYKYLLKLIESGEDRIQYFKEYMKKKYGVELGEFWWKYSEPNRELVLSKILRNRENSVYKKIKRSITYTKDCIRKMSNNRNLVVSFSGVDGAGKSTLISELKEVLENKYRREVVVLRHRPGILPILSAWKHGKEKAEKISMSRLPRKGENKSSIGSILRFAYYYIDYLIGQFWVKVKYQWRGVTVLYDRYYFDFIVDQKRSNLVLNSAIPKRLMSWIFQPNLNVFLYADPSTILNRKQELDEESIVGLTSSYLSLFNELGSTATEAKYLPLKNEDKMDSLSSILKFIKG